MESELDQDILDKIIIGDSIKEELSKKTCDENIIIAKFILDLISNKIENSIDLDDEHSLTYLADILYYNNCTSLRLPIKIVRKINEKQYPKSKKFLTIKINYDIYNLKHESNRAIFSLPNLKSENINKENKENKENNKNSFEIYIEKDQETINKIYNFIDSFCDKKFINSLKMSYIIEQNNKFSKRDWKSITEEEIIRRLERLKLFLGNKFFKVSDVKLISYINFEQLEYDDKLTMYINLVNKLKAKILDIKNTLILLKSLKGVLKEQIEIESKSLEDNSYISSESDSEKSIPEDSMMEYNIEETSKSELENKLNDKDDKDDKENKQEIDDLLDEYFENKDN